MSVLNKMTKGLFYIGLFFLVILESYVLGLFLSGAVLSIILAVWSIIKPLPVFFMDRMWLVYSLSGIPASIYIFVFICSDVVRGHLEKHKKQDNRNH